MQTGGRLKIFVIYGKAEIFLPYSQSLKDKRRLVKGVIERLKKRLSISVAEVDCHDLRQRSIVGFSFVAPQNHEVEYLLQMIRETLYLYSDQMEITALDYEINNVFND